MDEVRWDFVYSNWTTILSILKSKLPTKSNQSMDEKGNLVPSGRPMIEDIHECKVHKNERLFMYLGYNEPSVSIVRKGNEVYAKLGTHLKIKQE